MHSRAVDRVRVALRVALFGIAFALPVSADAPISGPDRQYDDFDADDKLIIDRFTNLVWQRPSSPYPPAVSFAQAQTRCADLGDGFRLPTLKELLTLVDEQPHDEYDGTQPVPRAIDRNAFAGTPAEPFWTSSAKSGTEVWTVDFGSGETKYALAGDPRRVRCVAFAP